MGYGVLAEATYECAHSEVDASESDGMLLGGAAGAPAASRGRRKVYLALGCTGALALASCAAARRLGPLLAAGGEPVSKEVVKFVKPSSNCSKWSEDCRATGCCVTTGHTCWEKDSKTAFCKQDCPADKGWTCKDLSNYRYMEVNTPGTSMYCYAVVFQNKGGKLQVPEADLLRAQREKGLGIFGCGPNSYDVFSDVEVSLGAGLNAIQLFDEDNDFCKFERPDTGACANTAIFYQAWRKIRATQKWRDHEWVVKADADAVFVPSRLASLLTKQKQPSTGVYYENCKSVDSGFFGSLEVISTKGFGIFMDKLENCKWTLPWDGNPSSGWKYGPWGEDKFAQDCMDTHGVGKAQLFELTYDGLCPSDRPEDQKDNKKFVPPCWNSTAPATHPFMSVSSWMECYDTTMKVTV